MGFAQLGGSSWMEKQPGLQDAESKQEYTPEVLREMHKCFLPKPEQVSEAQWIAAIPPVSEKIKALQDMEKAIAEVGGKFAPGDKSLFALLYPTIMREAVAILQNPEANDRNKITLIQWIGDHQVGKASQQIEHTGNFVHEFRSEIKEIEKKMLQARDVTATDSRPLDNISHSVDSFIESVGGKDYVVGKRGTSGEESKSQSTEGFPAGASTSSESEESES